MPVLLTLYRDSFLEWLDEEGRALAKSAALLDEAVRTQAPNKLIQEIERLQAESSTRRAALSLRLSRTLITPVNHEDLLLLAKRLFAILRDVSRAGRLIVELTPAPLPLATAELSTIIREACDALTPHMASIGRRNRRPVDIQRFHAMRDRANLAASNAMLLLLERQDGVAALRAHELYRFLNSAVRGCKQAADSLHYVALKNG